MTVIPAQAGIQKKGEAKLAMVTRVVAGRTYDFSHAMGRGGVGAGFNSGNALAFSSDNLVYVLSRGGEAVTAVPWHRTARGRAGLPSLTWASSPAMRSSSRSSARTATGGGN